MVIRMTEKTHMKAGGGKVPKYRNTRAEFKRLKTILPSIRRKENVSKLDIILEAIKYIDDLQDQLFDRLTGTHSQREATLLALTEQDMAARVAETRQRSELVNEAAAAEDLTKMVLSLSSSSSSSDEEDNQSHASLEL